MATEITRATAPTDFFKTWVRYEDGTVEGHAEVLETGTREEVAQWLEQQTEETLNREDVDGHTPVEYAMTSLNNPHILEALLTDPRIEIRKKTDLGLGERPVRSDWTMLHEAARNGNAEQVQVIVNSGRLDLNSIAINHPGTPVEQRMSPLSIAIDCGYGEIARILCDAGVDPRPLFEEIKKRQISPEAQAFLRLNPGQLQRLERNENMINILQPYTDNKVKHPTS